MRIAHNQIGRRSATAALAVVIGAVVGGGVYYASRLSGMVLYIVVSAVAALVGASIRGWFTRSTVISQIEVTVPQLSKVTFAVPKDQRAMARDLVTELTTRIATRTLNDGTGQTGKAIKSLFDFFIYVRQLLHDHNDAQPVQGHPNAAILAMNMLSLHLGPFLEKWHPRYDDWRGKHKEAPESDWADDEKFRVELRHLQADLRGHAIGFAKLGGINDYTTIIGLDNGE
ncbi:MAG TPA: hypothetical protein VHX38_09340 [Pseudonocardiaceae bacterium]|nr:hypothetical protein [Pseudonocardiaceae bacterium]